MAQTFALLYDKKVIEKILTKEDTNEKKNVQEGRTILQSKTMIRAFSNKIGNALEAQGIIDNENKELYVYGIHQGFMMLIHIITTITIGAILGFMWQSAVFLLSYAPIRSYAGGIHAKTPLRCYLITLGITALSLMAIGYIPWTPLILAIVTLIASGTIFFLAPIEDQNKPLRPAEVIAYRKRTRAILCGEIIIIAVAVIFDVTALASVFCVSLALLGTFLVLGKIKNQHLLKQK